MKEEIRMTDLITDYDEEWNWWAELFAELWPKMWLYDLAEMADRMLLTFGDNIIIGDGWSLIGQ